MEPCERLASARELFADIPTYYHAVRVQNAKRELDAAAQKARAKFEIVR